MTKTFVATNDAVHDLLRNVTRRTPLRACLAPDGRLRMEYKVDPRTLPDLYFGLAWFHSLKGMPASTSMNRRPGPAATIDMVRVLERVGYFDVVKLDRRCARDLRLKPTGRSGGIVCGELLNYGTGTLRACNDNPADRLHRILWGSYGHLAPKDEVIYANIRCLAGNTPLGSLESWKETFNSTNVIYGDAMGEIQQLWDRRADISFLDQVARSLQHIRPENGPASFLNPPRNVNVAIRFHLRCQSRWKKPPEHGRALLRRVEWILDNTIVDNAPATQFRWREAGNQVEPGSHETPTPGWQPDGAGYDGWLGSGDAA